MKRIGEYAEGYFPRAWEFFFGKKTTLEVYSYNRIVELCNRALAPDRVEKIPNRNEYFNAAYLRLQQADTPAPFIAAALIGLARAGNLEIQDVESLRDATFVLLFINQRAYRPFCAAIERKTHAIQIMPRFTRPDYASSSQLAEIAASSHEAFRRLQWDTRIRFSPYIDRGGAAISSRKDFVAALSSDDTLGGACVRFAVDLGVLTTKPEEVSEVEKEWLRKNIHYIKMRGNSRLNLALDKFNNFL